MNYNDVDQPFVVSNRVCGAVVSVFHSSVSQISVSVLSHLSLTVVSPDVDCLRHSSLSQVSPCCSL